MSIDLPVTPQPDFHAMQCPPCGIYDVTNGAGTRVFRILSLGAGALVSNPVRTWLPNREHWFSTKGADVAGLLAVPGPAKLTLFHRSATGGVDQTIQTIANQLAVPTAFKFQIYSKGLLSQADWIAGVPSVTSPNYYFVEQSGTPNRAARPLFETDPANGLLLAHVNWFTLDNTVAGYLVNAPDGASITLPSAATGTIPTNGWYYRAP
jgi:hypothetical protein